MMPMEISYRGCNYQIFKLILMTFLPLIVFFVPVEYIEANPLPCLYKILFNQECWGCGITRACLHMLHFNINEAILFNRAVVIVFPLACILYVKEYILTLRRIFNLKSKKSQF